MKQSYLTLKRILLASAATYLEKGDILTYDVASKKNNLTIFRGGDLVATVTHSYIGVTALVQAGVLELLDNAKKPATVKPIVAPPPVAAKPKMTTLKQPSKPVVGSIPASHKPFMKEPDAESFPERHYGPEELKVEELAAK